MNYVQVNNLDFNNIKSALKEYLRAQTDFTDFDFEGSVWSNLIDVLSYNTYYTAFNTNMVVNELFLESATLRDNVISIAKQLGYKPKSVVAPKAVVSFNVNFAGTAPDTIILRRGTGFVTNFDDTLYRFVTVEDYKAPVINGVATFNNIEIFEGSLIVDSYTINSALTKQRFVLANPSADTSTIKIKVYPIRNASKYEYYTQVTSIVDINTGSKIFYVDEIADEQYELFFGDGVLGRKLANNEFVEVSYLVTNGLVTNGARIFTFSGVLEDKDGNVYPLTVNNISTVSAASGGAEIENIDRIKFNAPKLFSTQNRAVTASDYAAIVRDIYPAVSDIIVYGGEEERYPEFGKVKIVVKPNSGSALSSFTKQQIRDALKDYSVASVSPEIIDPSVVFIELTSHIYYNTKITNQYPEEIRKKVISSIEEYSKQSDTEKFNGKFRYSKYVGLIDEVDRSINSNTTSIALRKDFYPLINSSAYYELCFQNSFQKFCDTPTLHSSGFIFSEYPNYTVYMEDRDGKIVLYRIDSATGDKVVLKDNIGIIDYVLGEIKLYDLTILSGTFFDNRIEVRIVPESNDITAQRNLFLDVDISNSKFAVYPE